MDSRLKDFLKGGGRFLMDTKTPKHKMPKSEVPKKAKDALMSMEAEVDPRKKFVQKCIKEKPSKKDIVQELKKWIEVEESKV